LTCGLVAGIKFVGVQEETPVSIGVWQQLLSAFETATGVPWKDAPWPKSPGE
jgi:hypothetical protein